MKYFKKLAEVFNVSDVENNLGYFYSDKEEPIVRKKITEEHKKRLGLRHPWLTGIPTLGVWPAISKSNAMHSIARSEAKRNKDIAKSYMKQKRHNEKMNAAYYNAYSSYNSQNGNIR